MPSSLLADSERWSRLLPLGDQTASGSHPTPTELRVFLTGKEGVGRGRGGWRRGFQ